jgi:CRP-like cAMP-binding protein
MGYRIDVLRDVPGLTYVPDADLEKLAEEFTLETFKDALICTEGTPSEHLYVLAEGQADVLKQTDEGRRYKVATLMPGVLFGHVGVLTVQPRTASVRVVGQAKMLVMSARRARELLRDADFAVASPFRRALIVALSRQLFSATATTMKLAVDAGLTVEAALGEPRPVEHGDFDGAAEAIERLRGEQV